MLSSLQQGSLVYIIDKTKSVKYLIGEVINKTEPKTEYQNVNIGVNPQMFFDISVKVENDVYEFKHINTNLNVVNYSNGNTIISETKEALIPIVETLLHNSHKIVDNIEFHKQTIIDCESILKQLNPTFAKEKERDEAILNLETRMNNIDDKLDRMFNLINSKQNG